MKPFAKIPVWMLLAMLAERNRYSLPAVAHYWPITGSAVKLALLVFFHDAMNGLRHGLFSGSIGLR